METVAVAQVVLIEEVDPEGDPTWRMVEMTLSRPRHRMALEHFTASAMRMVGSHVSVVAPSIEQQVGRKII